jgi:glycosyltransferase involved in cell wall biosynthesis
MIHIYTGSYPPDVCGVGDFTYNLAEELKKHVEVKVVKLSLINFLYILIVRLTHFKSQTVAIQYPTANYGKSILPHLICIISRIFQFQVISTVHEYSSLSYRARLFARLFFLFSNKTYFINNYELEFARKEFRFGNFHVIPVVSNIPVSNSFPYRDIDACYFGIISPNKGIEDFLKICKDLNSQLFRVYLIGQISPKFKDYAEEIISE